jgi:hypothetical protein
MKLLPEIVKVNGDPPAETKPGLSEVITGPVPCPKAILVPANRKQIAIISDVHKAFEGNVKQVFLLFIVLF